MNIDKRHVNVFLMLWIKHDREVWQELRDIQIKLLLDRIVKEMSFKAMAEKHKTQEDKIRQIFNAILTKIERCISAEVAEHLRAINLMLEQRPERPFETIEIYKN